MRAVEAFRFWVPGTPVQQGSKTARAVGDHAVMWDQNAKALKPWRKTVKEAAAAAYAGPMLDDALVAVLEFRFLRPKSVRREWPSVKPDVDKLQRSIFDALTDSKTIRDDARFVRVTASKVYADVAGVLVRVGVCK